MAKIYRDAGRYTARVLNGEPASELPISLPSKFELIINQKAAIDLGLPIPPRIIAMAD